MMVVIVIKSIILVALFTNLNLFVYEKNPVDFFVLAIGMYVCH